MYTQADTALSEVQLSTAMAEKLEDGVRRELTAAVLDVLDRHLKGFGQSQQEDMRRLEGLQERLMEALSAMSKADDADLRIAAEEIRMLRGEVARLQEENASMALRVREKEEFNTSLAERCAGLLDRANRAEQLGESALAQCQELRIKVADAVERLAAAEANKAAALSREQALLLENDSLERRLARLQESWEQITGSPASSTL